jgi:hypothetical protein
VESVNSQGKLKVNKNSANIIKKDHEDESEDIDKLSAT